MTLRYRSDIVTQIPTIDTVKYLEERILENGELGRLVTEEFHRDGNEGIDLGRHLKVGCRVQKHREKTFDNE